MGRGARGDVRVVPAEMRSSYLPTLSLLSITHGDSSGQKTILKWKCSPRGRCGVTVQRLGKSILRRTADMIKHYQL